MHKIAELIGIVNGINSDNIVNDKEIEHLKNWVAQNKNFANGDDHIKLIGMIDNIIETKHIDKEMIEEVTLYCELLQLENNDQYTSKLYELNGIIEGIICDGQVNEAEVISLSNWTERNSKILRGNTMFKNIRSFIDDILLDNVVTEEEQAEFLDFLNECIGSSKLEAKINFLKNEVREKRNIGMHLIKLLDNEEVIDKINHKAEKNLHTALTTGGGYIPDKEIIFISLTLIALMYYDGNYYDHVEDVYDTLYNGSFSRQRIEGQIRDIIKKYALGTENGKKEYRLVIDAVLQNTIVPKEFLKAFFEFIYDIYKLNFEYELPDNLSDDFRFVYEGLKNNMSADSDDLKLNVTKKSYKLIKSTKRIISDGIYLDDIIDLSTVVIKLIDRYMWGKENEIYNPYLKYGYDKWTVSLEKENVDRTDKKSNSSRWEPHYILQGNLIYLVPPSHRIKNDYDFKDIKIVVMSGDDVIYENKTPYIKEIIGGYKVIPDQILIDNPLNEISYKIMALNEEIYSSKDILHRNILAFNFENGSEIKNNTDFTGTVILCVNTSIEDSSCMYSDNNYKLISLNMHEGDTAIIGDEVLNFSSYLKPGIYGAVYEDKFITLKNNDENVIQVYSDAGYFVFEADDKYENIRIVINERMHSLSEYSHNITHRSGINKYSVDLENLDDGIYSMAVVASYKGTDERIVKTINFAVDKEISTDFIKLNDEAYYISVVSGILEQPINRDVFLSDFDDRFIEFTYKGKQYIYNVLFDYDVYNLNDKWYPMSREIWIDELKSDTVLRVYTNPVECVVYYDADDEYITTDNSFKQSNMICQISVGFLRTYKEKTDFVQIDFMQNRSERKSVKLYNKCVIDDTKTEIVYDHKMECLDIIPFYKGQGKVFFKIFNQYDEELYKSSFLENGIVESVEGLASFKTYTITFYEKEKGLSLRKERELCSYQKIFYAKKDFIGKSFKIKEAYFDKLIGKNFERKYWYLNSTYVYFIRSIDEYAFEGEVYFRTYRGACMLDNINPVRIELCGDAEYGKMEISITKDGDGLLLDFEHNGILNEMDDMSAPDILSYDIILKGEDTF